jgi:hypothetical protein
VTIHSRAQHGLLAARLCALVVCLCLASESLATESQPQEHSSAAQTPEQPRYFYFGYDYGTQALYSPLWVFINRGYDTVQDNVGKRDVFAIKYKLNGENILDNLAHPIAAINGWGWKRFLREEVFPLSWETRTARWVPNYALHLLGGGMTYRGLTEWWRDAGAPLPRFLAGVTVMASAYLNEIIENRDVVGRNTDCLADMYIFDLAGMLLFSFDGPNRFFSQTVVVMDWSLQPALTLPSGYLHNVGNYFAARWALPFYPRLSLFTYFGQGTSGGLSFRLDDEYSISAAGGLVGTKMVNPSTRVVENTLSFVPTAGVFIDRRNSLIASAVVSDLDDYFVQLNLYPHALWSRGPGLGAWLVVDKEGRPAGGISIAALLGAGVGASAHPHP